MIEWNEGQLNVKKIFIVAGNVAKQSTITDIDQPPTPSVSTAPPTTTSTTVRPIAATTTTTTTTSTTPTTSPTNKGRTIPKTADELSVTTLGSMERTDKDNNQMDWTPVIIGAVVGIVLVIVTIVVVCVVLKKSR